MKTLHHLSVSILIFVSNFTIVLIIKFCILYLKYLVLAAPTGDLTPINGALETAHSLFRKYRYELKSQKLWTEIKFVLDTLAKPLTELFVVSF